MTHPQSAPDPVPAQQTISTRTDAVGLCNRLNDCIANMTELLSAETNLIKAKRAPDIETLQSDKLSYTQAYLKDYNLLKQNAAVVGAQAPVEVNKVREILHDFNIALRENLHALAAAKTVSESVVNVIAEAAREAKAGPTCYGANANVHVEGNHRAAAIAVDRKF